MLQTFEFSEREDRRESVNGERKSGIVFDDTRAIDRISGVS